MSVVNLITKYAMNNPDVIGEAMRAAAFGTDKGLGCYDTFEVEPGWARVEVTPEYFEEFHGRPYDPEGNLPDRSFICSPIGDEEMFRRTFAYWNDEHQVLMMYYWDGDGSLYFRSPDFRVINDDCKVEYYWEFVVDKLRGM